MKKLVLLMLLVPALAFGTDINWAASTSYTNGSPIPPGTHIKYRLYADGIEFATVLDATTWTGTIPQQPGEVKVYTATAELDGQAQTRSEHSPPTTFAYFIPLNAPGAVTIQLGQ